MSLGEHIRSTTSSDAAITVRAPGRVNLIGEHTDYSLLPVLPIAIDRAIEIRAMPGVGLRADSQSFGAAIEMSPEVDLERLRGWHRYVHAAATVCGVWDADILISGDLPSAGGLSSSSALTVGVLAALTRVAGRDVSKDQLVAMAVRAERLTGVAGGAMDQTIIVHAQHGSAARIGFHPQSIQQVPVPEALAFVVGHSGATAAKGSGARDHYNTRVVACRLAAAQLAAAVGAAVVPDTVLAHVADHSDINPAVGELVETASAADLGRPDIAESVGVDPHRVVAIRESAAHVLCEASRVDAAVDALASADVARLGHLFDASHASLQRFGASTDGLDRVVAAMRSAGAAGARLTGAGFGGFAVAVTDPSRVSAVVEAAADAGGGPAFSVQPSEGLA